MSDDRAEHESTDVETQFDPRHPLIFQRGYDPDADGAAGAGAGPGGSDSLSRSWRARRPSAPVFPSHDPAARQARGQADGQAGGQADLQADLRFRRPETTDAAAGAGVLTPGVAANRDAREPVLGEPAPGESAQVQGWDPDQPAYPRRNPYIVALWIVGIGLIVGGIAFQWWASSRQFSYSGSSNEMPIEVVLSQVLWSSTPAMISTGMLTIVGLIVWKALRWQEQEGSSSASVPLGDGNE